MTSTEQASVSVGEETLSPVPLLQLTLGFMAFKTLAV
jgi:hypothetical protein